MMSTAVATVKKPRKRLSCPSVVVKYRDVCYAYILINKAQVSVSTAARHTGHLCFQTAISFSDRRKPNLSNLLVGECTAGMESWTDLGTKESGCLRKLATASPTVAERNQFRIS